jgi:hypothetical protein
MLIDKATYDAIQISLYKMTAEVRIEPDLDELDDVVSLIVNGILVDNFYTYTDALNHVISIVNKY